MTRRAVPRVRPHQKLNLVYSACGYGIVRRAAPERCPMCLREGTWVHPPWRPFVHGRRPEP